MDYEFHRNRVQQRTTDLFKKRWMPNWSVGIRFLAIFLFILSFFAYALITKYFALDQLSEVIRTCIMVLYFAGMLAFIKKFGYWLQIRLHGNLAKQNYFGIEHRLKFTLWIQVIFVGFLMLLWGCETAIILFLPIFGLISQNFSISNQELALLGISLVQAVFFVYVGLIPCWGWWKKHMRN